MEEAHKLQLARLVLIISLLYESKRRSLLLLSSNYPQVRTLQEESLAMHVSIHPMFCWHTIRDPVPHRPAAYWR